MKNCLRFSRIVMPALVVFGLSIFNATPAARAQCTAPTIISQPTNQTVLGDSHVTFSVKVSSPPGCGPVIYEWYEVTGVDGNPTPIPGGTNASVTITARNIANDPDYNSFGCRIENAGGVIFIPEFRLTVIGGTYEAEYMTDIASSGDTVRYNSEPAASGGLVKMVDSNAVGDFVTSEILNVPAGTYNVRVRFKKHPSRGKVQVSVGKVGGTLGNIGPVIDLYAANQGFQEYNLGNWTANSTSDKQFRFKITGKNPGSSGYTMCMDYVKLVKQ